LKCQELAEAVCQDGEAAPGRGEADEAAVLFENAIDSSGRGLCADDKQGRDRIVAMRRVVMEVRGGRTIRRRRGPRWRWQMIWTIMDCFRRPLALYQEAIELLTEVRFQYATSMCASACIACTEV